MNTQLSYFEDTYKFEDHAIIEANGKDENGDFIILNQTIFYPQGGGQPSDRGTLEVGDVLIPIHSIKCIANEVRHYTDQGCSHLVGQEVKCSLDRETRLLHARLHTSGHLISNVIEHNYPCWRGVKGHHFPGQCYVEFASKNSHMDNVALEFVHKELEKFIEADCLINVDQVASQDLQEMCPNLAYSIPSDQPIRVMRIGDFPFSPCGGTHIKSLKELNGLEITKCKVKNKIMRINYHIN